MKILIDARFYGLENAGLGRYAINLVQNLAKIDSKNEYFILLRKKYFLELKLPDNWEKVLADFGHYSVSEQIKLPKIISKINPDLCHFLHFNVPVFYKGPYVVTIHDLLMHKQKGTLATTLPAPVYFAKRLGYMHVFKRAVFNSKKIVVPSNTVKTETLNYYTKMDPDKIVVSYEGIDDKTFPKKNGVEILKKYEIDKPYFIYVGNAYPHKNITRAIEAIVYLNEQDHKDCLFIIISSRNVFVQRLEKIINELGAKQYVKLLGFVPDADLGPLLKNSCAFLYASISEGFGLQGLEAMSAGTLVLASDIPVFKEVYKSYVRYFNPYDFTDIERAMNTILELPQTQRKEIIKNSQDLLKKYSWAKMAKETLEVYKQVFEQESK